MTIDPPLWVQVAHGPLIGGRTLRAKPFSCGKMGVLPVGLSELGRRVAELEQEVSVERVTQWCFAALNTAERPMLAIQLIDA